MIAQVVFASDFSGLAFERLFYYGIGLLVVLVAAVGLVVLLLRKK